MKFKEYVENLQKFLKENPESAEYEVITSVDDEGNGFYRVHCEPSLGHYDEDDRDFTTDASIADEEIWSHLEINAVCVN